jgi:hypothetical protein
LPKISFSLPEIVLDEPTARFGRLQNSPSAQTVVIADPTFRLASFAKTFSMAAQMDFIWARTVLPRTLSP